MGFVMPQPFEITDLLAQRHFGLVGMYERAALIDAQLNIQSWPGAGMQVILSWPAGDPPGRQGPSAGIKPRPSG